MNNGFKKDKNVYKSYVKVQDTWRFVEGHDISQRDCVIAQKATGTCCQKEVLGNGKGGHKEFVGAL